MDLDREVVPTVGPVAQYANFLDVARRFEPDALERGLSGGEGGLAAYRRSARHQEHDIVCHEAQDAFMIARR